MNLKRGKTLSMTSSSKASEQPNKSQLVTRFQQFVQMADYSLMNQLHGDPDSREDGKDHRARQVFSGHFVPVTPSPLAKPEYVGHSKSLFTELGLSDELVLDKEFCKIFTGDLSTAPRPMSPQGWATGYALSIYVTEYTAQCPFRNGNGYGDGRAISVFEGKLNGRRWEMQLKGGGATPYCRGADGRAVLRSSVREFLAQEYMHALGVPSSRSLTLYASQTEKVRRPWYSEASRSEDPDIMVEEPTAICTRVAPSFLRVGQIELFYRRARDKAHPKAFEELQMIVKHLIEREYKNEINSSFSLPNQVVELARLFRNRLTALVAQWLRVGYCQGNFNSDNCAAGGFTLDYGPFGFCEVFDPAFQPWTGGGRQFSFFNQPIAAEKNFDMFWSAIRPLVEEDSSALANLDEIHQSFSEVMQEQLKKVWASKLGLEIFSTDLFQSLIPLMIHSKLDYTIFFRELSNLPTHVSALKKSFYLESTEQLEKQWQTWLNQWRNQVIAENQSELTDISAKMKQANPKYTWREWLVAPAYQQAMQGDYSLIRELQEVLSQPYDEQSPEVEAKYYQLRPKKFFNAGGISHYSCSS